VLRRSFDAVGHHRLIAIKILPRLRQRQLHFHLIGLDRFPLRLQLFAGRILQHDAVDAADAVGLQVHGILAADDQCVFVAVRQHPGFRMRIAQLEAGPGVGVEAPIALQRGMHGLAQRGGLQPRRVDDVAALRAIGLGRQVDGLAVGTGQAQREVMRIAGRKYQRRAVEAGL